MSSVTTRGSASSAATERRARARAERAVVRADALQRTDSTQPSVRVLVAAQRSPCHAARSTRIVRSPLGSRPQTGIVSARSRASRPAGGGGIDAGHYVGGEPRIGKRAQRCVRQQASGSTSRRSTPLLGLVAFPPSATAAATSHMRAGLDDTRELGLLAFHTAPTSRWRSRVRHAEVQRGGCGPASCSPRHHSTRLDSTVAVLPCWCAWKRRIGTGGTVRSSR
jgi:hypothetical protein